MEEVQKANKVRPVPTLNISDGPLAGQTIRLDRSSGLLGRRDDNAYVVDDPGVSRAHVEIRCDASAVILTDLGSSAGTKVNGTKIEGPTVIRHGDRVSIGPVIAVFHDPVAAAEREDATMVFDVPRVETGPHLSPRQQQVLEGMAAGMTNAEIGEQLGVTERTVKAYASEMYDKLGVHNRAGAVAAGVKLDMLEHY